MLKSVTLSDELSGKLHELKNHSKSNEISTIDVEKIKKERSFKSYNDMIKSIRKQIKLISTKKSLDVIPDYDPSKSIKATVSLLSESILSTCDVAILTSGLYDSTLFIQNPTTGLMTSSLEFIKKILVDLSSNQINDAKLEINDISKTANQVLEKMKFDSSVRQLNELPKQYIIGKNDIVFDIKNQTLLMFDEIKYKYDILNKNNSSILIDHLLSNEDKQKILIYENIIQRVMKDWSEHDETTETLLWEIIFSVLQNDNHEKYIVIKGPGGNGKSTFMHLLSIFAGHESTQYINIHQFGDPNAINTISMNTKVVIGDDAATNHKISDHALSNLKSIISGQPISVPVKYAENRLIKTNAVFIQGTNTDLNFYENNPAVKSRLVVVPWTNTNFRDEKPSDITFDLSSLLDDDLFISTWLSLTLDKIKPFDKYTIPSNVEELTTSMLESNDILSQFLDDIIPEINLYPIIPLNPLYDNFTRFSKMMNPSSGLMKFQTFTKSIKEKIKQYGFSVSDDRRRFLKFDYKTSLCSILQSNDDQFCHKQMYLINQSSVTNQQLEQFMELHHPIEELTDRDRQLLMMLIHDKNHVSLLSIYGNELT